MPKLRKLRKQKKFRHNVNRKRLRKRIESTGAIKDPELRKEWEEQKSIAKNISSMGLSLDANQTIKPPTSKQDRLKFVKIINGIAVEEEPEAIEPSAPAEKQYVVDKMERDAKEYRPSNFRLPKNQVRQLEYFMNKYGRNYKEMTKDKKNYDQETWKQFKAKIAKFISIRPQFNKYLTKKKLEGSPVNLKDEKWAEYNSDSEI